MRRKQLGYQQGGWATRYQHEHGRGPSNAEYYLNNVQAGLEFLLMNSFARAGGERIGYGDIAGEALKEAVRVYGGYQQLLMLKDAGDIVWNFFSKICGREG